MIKNKLVLILVGSIAFSQGCLYFTDIAIMYLFKEEFGMTPAQLQSYMSFVILSWFIKPLWGYISDNYPINGYKRKPYLIIFSMLQIFCWLSMATWVNHEYSALLILLIKELSMCFCNVIGEAIMVENSRDASDENIHKDEQTKQKNASSNVSFFFGVKMAGAMTTVYLGGILIEIFSTRVVFAIAIIFPFIVMILSIWSPEMKIQPTNYQNMNEQVEQSEHDYIISIRTNSLFKLKKFIFQATIYKPLLFLLVMNISPSTQTAIFFFYTNVLKFHPDFVAEIKMSCAMGIIIGIIFYHRYMRNIEFKKTLIMTTLGASCIGMMTIVLVTNQNKMLGINDKVFAILDNFLYLVIHELTYIPILIYASRICPKDIEGTMYAVFTSIQNLGYSFSMLIGGVLTDILGITESDFTYLWILILIQNIWILFPLPFLKYIDFKAAQEFSDQQQSTIVEFEFSSKQQLNQT